MIEEWTVPGEAVLAAGIVAVALLVGLAVVLRRNRSAGELKRTREGLAALVVRVDDLERRLAAGPAAAAPAERDSREFVITDLGPGADGAAPAVAPPVPGTPTGAVPAPLFADLVLRETVVQAASLAFGVRRALSPRARSRIGFEVRREVKRARKQRRADLRQARRDFEARGRAAVDRDDAA